MVLLNTPHVPRFHLLDPTLPSIHQPMTIGRHRYLLQDRQRPTLHLIFPMYHSSQAQRLGPILISVRQGLKHL